MIILRDLSPFVHAVVFVPALAFLPVDLWLISSPPVLLLAPLFPYISPNSLPFLTLRLKYRASCHKAIFYFLAVLEIEPGALHVLATPSVTVLCPGSQNSTLKEENQIISVPCGSVWKAILLTEVYNPGRTALVRAPALPGSPQLAACTPSHSSI